MRAAGSRLSSAFTILELLVAIVILSILAAVAVPNFSRAVERGRVRDAQSVLAAVFEAERMYRLDEATYGRLREDLVARRYLSDPDPGGTTNTDWDFSTAAVAATTFTARATRTGGGGYNNMTVEVNEAFNGRAFGGNHPLRDQ